MKHHFLAGSTIGLGLVLAGCGGGMMDNDLVDTHTDLPSVVIDDGNALAIAADVYRVAAIDVPVTASVAMDPQDPNAINTAACTEAGALSSGMDGMGMDMNMGTGMQMVFRNCTLVNPPSSHELMVDGSCSNSGSGGMETVTGNKISFTSQGMTMGLHNFTVVRNNDDMTSARGSLHRPDGGIVNFETSSDFAGTAMVPTAGTLEISGAGNSRLRLSIVNGGTGFTLEVDADGDGVYDDPQPPEERNWNNDFWLALIP